MARRSVHTTRRAVEGIQNDCRIVIKRSSMYAPSLGPNVHECQAFTLRLARG